MYFIKSLCSATPTKMGSFDVLAKYGSWWLGPHTLELVPTPLVIATTLYSNHEFYDATASLDDVLSSPYSWLNIQGFDKVTISETKLNGVAMLQNASESGSARKSNGRVVIMWWADNHLHFSLGNNYTFNSQNSTRLFLLLAHLFPQLNLNVCDYLC